MPENYAILAALRETRFLEFTPRRKDRNALPAHFASLREIENRIFTPRRKERQAQSALFAPLREIENRIFSPRRKSGGAAVLSPRTLRPLRICVKKSTQIDKLTLKNPA